MGTNRFFARVLLVFSCVFFTWACQPHREQSEQHKEGKKAAPKKLKQDAGSDIKEPEKPATRTVLIEAPAFPGAADEMTNTRYETKFRSSELEELIEENKKLKEKRAKQTQEIRDRQQKEEKRERDNRLVLKSSLPKDKCPSSLDQFEIVPHLPPVAQYLTGTCWSFAGTSFVEAEVMRTANKKIKLSEMYTVYQEYLAKAERFVRERSKSQFRSGSEPNAIFRIIAEKGAVPIEAFAGQVVPDGRHNHELLGDELDELLSHIKRTDLWDEQTVQQLLEVILNRHLGEPPVKFSFEDEQYDPKAFAGDVLKLEPENYVAFMSTIKSPFFQTGEFEFNDNWWRDENYHNVPMDLFFEGIKNSIKNGYSVAVAIDVSEPGKDGENDVMFIPSFDIPGDSIDQLAREYRIVNRSTYDDHAIHFVGYARVHDHDWFLAKDSGRSAFRGKFKGYYFVRDDYVRLKVLAFVVHKEAVQDLLSRFKTVKRVPVPKPESDISG